MKDITVILDAGHGINCPGKCSPDLTYHEWQFCRTMVRNVAAILKLHDINVQYTWAEDHEPLSDPKRICNAQQLRDALNYRWRKVNEICNAKGTKNCISVSIHTNAAGNDGQWHSAQGLQVFVSPNASQASRHLAKEVYEQAEAASLQGNRYIPAQKYWTGQLAMCSRTNCPAILVECLYHDNRDDLAILQSPEGVHRIANAIANGIIRHISSL